MKKIGMLLMAMAAIALMAVPSLADDLATAEVGVTITVAEYGAIIFNPDSTMSFNVPGPYVTGADYGDTKDFKVLCNVPCNLTVVPDMCSASTDVVPGQIGDIGDPYPTATGTGDASGHYIGFGMALTNLDTPTSVGWGTGGDFTKVVVGFSPSLTSDLDPNARITLNSYMDSARYGDALAPAGDYGATLTVTLAPQS